MKPLEMISLQEACDYALTHTTPLSQSEVVSVTEARGRVLAQTITAQKNLPSFDNSAMDGFAFKASDAGKRLRVVQTIFAGDIPKATLKEGECYRIMTGAQVPSDADTIAPIELCHDVTDDAVTLPSNIKAGSNFRKKGEELCAGEPLFEAGHLLRASDIALLSAQGIVAVTVAIRPRIAIVSTGNEIKEPWERASDDEIYNANAFGIGALLETFGFNASYVGAIPDDLEATKTFIGNLKGYDAIITTGGISMGDADYLYEAFLANGLSVWFHGVNLKPGKGVTFGMMGSTLVMAMPGNPMATMLTVHALCIPALYRLAGATAASHTFTYAEFAHDLRLKSGRTNLVIGTMEHGVFIPTRNNKIGSGMLTPLSQSNAVAYFGEEIGSIEREDIVKVVLLEDATRAVENHTINRR